MQVVKDTTYFYLQLRKTFPKLPDEQARFMTLYFNAWSVRDKLPEDLLHGLVSTWADHDWSMLCFNYAMMYVRRVAHNTYLDDGPLGAAQYGKKVAAEIEKVRLDIENGGTKYMKEIMSMPPAVFFQFIEASLPPERRSEASEIMLKVKADWFLKLVAQNATYAYAQLHKILPKLPEQQSRFMALFVTSWPNKDKMPEDVLRSIVSAWSKNEWRFLCFEYTARYVDAIGGGSAEDIDAVKRWIKYAKETGEVIDAAMRDVENGSTESRKMWLEIPPEVLFQLVEKSLPRYRRSEAAEILSKAVEPDI